MSGKYLQNYAEPEIHALKAISTVFLHCICIPVFDEPINFIQRIITFIEEQPASLVIIVLNQPSHSGNIGYRCNENNLACRQILQQTGQLLWSNNNLQLLNYGNSSAILLVDRFSRGLTIPPHQGVGLARKIAADLALQLITQQTINCPWIYSTDADVRLPEDYFTLHEQKKQDNVAAFTANYKHIPTENNEIFQATQLYQERLDSYVNGLRYAGSQYAYHSLGSTLCINKKNYIQVRGFPKRAAGEDFYLLNKLRKTGLIICPKQPIINIESRQSNRTPFGTGPAVNEILLSTDDDKKAILYHPELFCFLKKLLCWLKLLSTEANNWSREQQWQSHLVHSEIFLKGEQDLIIRSLDALKFAKAMKHCLAQSRDSKTFDRQMHDWFDAFKTLKFLHFIRERSEFKNISSARYHQLTTKTKF